MNRALAFIPARRGSKGVPGKNTRPLAGKPMVLWTLEAALGCPSVVPFLSTDDPDVVRLAEEHGIRVEYKRPAHLASDEADMSGVVADGLRWLRAQGRLVEPVLLLQPTSPLRTANDVAAAVDLLCESGATSILGVSRMWTHPSECLRMWPDGRWSYLVSPVKRVTRRQDYPDVPYYFVNGAIYGFFASRFLEDGCFITDDCRLLVMDDLNSVDIDTERDFRVAEALLTWKAQRG